MFLLRSRTIRYAALIALITSGIASCKHEGPEGLDKELLLRAQQDGPRQWFDNTPELFPRSNGSGHPEAFLRTRYDTIAMRDVDSAGHVEPGAVFDAGAFIVKELYTEPGRLHRYAIMYKQPGHPDADADGWIWSEVGAGGEVVAAASQRGSACRGCHGQEGHIDRTLMDAAFPQ